LVTNVSKPIWRCDICGHRFDEDEAAAERCESAGQPFVLPAGSLLLDYDSGHRTPGFRLRRLFPFPGRIGTVATTYDKVRKGHTRTYALDLDPADHWDEGRRYYTWPNHSQPTELRSEHLVPLPAGVLQVRADSWYGHHYGRPHDRTEAGWVLDAVGLPRSEMNPTDDFAGRWAKPLTEPVRELLDALGAYPRPIWTRPDLRRFRDEWVVNFNLGNLVLGTVALLPTGQASQRRATWFLRGADREQLVTDLNGMWAEWRGGTSILDRREPGQVCVPKPHLVSTREGLTASKLSKKLKELVAAAGVDWPPRTDATAYANLLIEKTLEYRVDTTHTMFPGRKVVLVRGRKGGVGKSTVAAALARRLAFDGAKVVLVDFDVTGPSQHIIHSLGKVPVDTDRVMVLPTETGVARLSVFSPGQVFGPEAKDQWSDTTTGQWIDFVASSLDLGDADIVVCDMPPGESGLHNTLDNRGDYEVHVTTGHPLALADVERDLVTAARAGRRFLVENMSRITGHDGTGRQVELRLHGTTEEAPKLAQRTGTVWAGSLPWEPSITGLTVTPQIEGIASAIAAGPGGAA
jgi:Mrp family chromosome partitioning ATPase